MKKILLALSIPYLVSAHTMTELFTALKDHAQTKVDQIAVQKAKVAKKQVDSQLYPKINLFGKYDNYSSPTSILPVPPNTMFKMVPNQSIAQPFSYNIYRTGVSFGMPIFVKSIYTYAKEAKAMIKSAEAKKRINLLRNEAIIVAENANFLYLNAFKKSLQRKVNSLDTIKKITEVKVKNGRAPGATLYKIEDAITAVAIAQNNIAIEREKIISSIEALTGVVLKKPVAMKQIGTYQEDNFRSLQPLRQKVTADHLAVQAKREKFYPTLLAHGDYTRSYANSYNNHLGVYENYGNIGITLTIPLLAMDHYEDLSKAKVDVLSDETVLQREKETLAAKAHSLKASLSLLNNSILLEKQNVQNRKQLLHIAQISYKSGRMTIEEYLRYEDSVVAAEAMLYKAEALRWQTLMELAVIYANKIEEIVQ